MSYDIGALYYDPILTGFSVGFQSQQFYGERLAPPTPVSQISGRYRVFDRSNWLVHADRREPGTVANEIGGRKWSEDTFITKERSLQARINDEEREVLLGSGGLADPTFGGAITIDPEQDATEDTTESLRLRHEQKVSSIFRDASNYPADNVVTLTAGAHTQFSDYTGGVASASDPVSVIRTAMWTVFMACRRWPNTMIIPLDAVGVIENHPRVVARYQYTSVLDPMAWRLMMGLPEGAANAMTIFVVDSVYNTADNIDMPEDIQSFWGQDIWLGIVDPTPGQKTKTFSKTFYFPYQNGGLRTVDRWREENKKSDVVRTSTRYDVKLVSPAAGYLIKTAVAPVV